ncbi:serine hydrolase domain-containing protein [Amycolatopsis anabasis]|uniref:serine hydrolase domain-containing protein n=1 Tax=Amycolatopsis anabasis TaxID=1840409 RepID=UPI00131DE1C1|nr:serine hydrolase domain-containing protein [Amycolatopsis anabasis]
MLMGHLQTGLNCLNGAGERAPAEGHAIGTAGRQNSGKGEALPGQAPAARARPRVLKKALTGAFDRRTLLVSAGMAGATAAFVRAAGAAPGAPPGSVVPRGRVEPRFDVVRDAFAANFRDQGEVGAALAVYHRGRLVVDLWGGVADVPSGRPWAADTTALWNSSTKGATTTVVHLLSERGLLDVNAPVREYWPEFADAGKQGITVAQILAHRSGVVVIDRPLTLADVVAWRPLAEALAAQRPVWTPNSRHGYHVQNFGYLLDEIVRRITGESIGKLFAKEIAAPLGLDFWLGLPADQEPRVAPLIAPDPKRPVDERIQALDKALADPTTLVHRATVNPLLGLTWDVVNTPEYHAAPLTSANGIGTARAMARHYASLVGAVDGIRLLSPQTIARAALINRSSGPDGVIPAVGSAWGLGYAKRSELFPFPAEACFGHMGSGGSMAFADPVNQLAFAYLPTQLIRTYDDQRSIALTQAVYRSI